MISSAAPSECINRMLHHTLSPPVPSRTQTAKEGVNHLRKVSKKINYYCAHVSALVLFALLLMTVADVFLRFVFNSPIRGSFELTQMMIPLIVYLSCAHAHDSGDHVVVDVIYEVVPFVAKWVISMLGHIVYLGLMIILSWRLFDLSLDIRSTGAFSSQLELPTWPILMLGAIAIVGYVVSLLFELGTIIFKREVLGDDFG